MELLLIVQTSGSSPVEVGVMEIPIIYRVLYIQKVVGDGISEPSAVLNLIRLFLGVKPNSYMRCNYPCSLYR